MCDTHKLRTVSSRLTKSQWLFKTHPDRPLTVQYLWSPPGEQMVEDDNFAIQKPNGCTHTLLTKAFFVGNLLFNLEKTPTPSAFSYSFAKHQN